MVADFGLSDWEENLVEGAPVCGTPGYLSPEVIAREKCTTASDVWAIGVIAYILLAGYPPFFAAPDEPDTDETVLRKILKCEYKFHESSWSHTTTLAKDFITTLLNPDPLKRPTCQEALKLPWLSDRENLKNKLNDEANKQEISDTLIPENFTCCPAHANKWTMGQMLAFSLSMLIILSSYTGLVLYVFKVDLGFLSFVSRQLSSIHHELMQCMYDCSESYIKCWGAIIQLLWHCIISIPCRMLAEISYVT